ncbi:MAG: beta-lactamase [Gemmatimonadetes bacterium]|nr:beta-lactamase [Gemmatimonadota bacterium]
MRAAVLLLLCLSSTAAAQNGHPLIPAAAPEEVGFSSARLSRIDSLVTDLVAQRKVPGAVVYIARHGKVAYYKAWGYRDLESREPLRRDDIFRMASQSKAIASLAVMMLWEEGRFGLDDPVSRYIPEFAQPTVLTTFNPADSSYTAEPAGREITIRQLLTHTSGLDYAAIGHDEFKAIYAKAGVPSGIGNDRYTIGEKVKVLAKLPLRTKPGTEFNYSLGLDVLGYLVEVVSGMPFDRFLRTRIFDPLGMNDTWFYLPKDRAGRLVTLHDGESGTAVPMKRLVFDGVDPDYPKLAGTYFSGGAGLSGPVEDYARFLQLFLNGGEYNGVRLLSPKTVQMMLTDQLPGMDTDVGLGFGLETEVNDYRSPKSVGSFSWGGAFATTYWADPKEDLVALLYTNMYNTRTVNYADRFTTFTYAAIER